MSEDTYTHIEFLLDRSTSMWPLIDTVIEGYNNFLKANTNQPGKLTCSMRQFSTGHVDTYTMVEGSKVPMLSNESFKPEGMTALIDAAVNSIDRLKSQISEMKRNDRPTNVIFVVYTDGEENSSRVHTASELNARIKEQEEMEHWEFVYLGTHANAFGQARDLGFNIRKTGGYTADSVGAAKGFQDVTSSVISYRSGQSKEVLINQKGE